MKNLKRIVIWALLSLSLQAAGLYLLEQMYFKHSSDFKVEKVEEKPIESTITFPSGIDDVKISFSGKYCFYFRDNNLYTMNTKSGEENEVKIEDSKEVLYVDWIENVNRLILVIRDENNLMQLYTYDIYSKTEHKVKDLGQYSQSVTINEIAISSKTGVKYIELTWGNSKPVIYRIDINETLTKINYITIGIEDIISFNNKDVLIYKSNTSNTFYSYSNGKNKKVDLQINNRLDILGTDSNDNVYFGEYEGDKIYRIVYGKVDTKDGEWNSVSLDESKNKEDIHITQEGNILINDTLSGKVLNKTTGNIISYKGKFISMNDKIIFSNKNNYIYIKSIKDVDSSTEV